MLDTNILNGCRVAYIEPKSLVHDVLSYISAKKLMAILCSEPDTKKKVFRPGVEEDPNYILAKEITSEFNMNPTGFQWMASSNIILKQMSMKVKPGLGHSQAFDLYVTITSYGEEILEDLEKGMEVELYLDYTD